MTAAHGGGAPLLPPAVAGWPSPLRLGGDARPLAAGCADALRRIRAETLWWPAPRAGASKPRVVAVGGAGVAAARARFADAEIAASAAAAAFDPAAVDPERLEAVFGLAAPAAFWARMGGLPVDAPVAAAEVLTASAAPRCPWRGVVVDLAAAVEAQAVLRSAAMRARGPVALVGMSRWKRRCLRPFLTGPDGPPRALRRRPPPPAAGPVALWGAADGDDDALRVEDGFLRSVGLGLRHTPPLSLAIRRGAPHFDATRRNAFEETVATAVFTPALLRRAAALRARILKAGLTKYSLDGAPALTPTPGAGRARVLVCGQVESDASIRLGARAVRDNLSLLAAARARFPDAFLLYKPHPDVETGLRPGAVSQARTLRLADAVASRTPAAACLDWAERVVSITSLIGFEALLRGKAATCFGRPFYAGWGLTDDVDPPPRDCALNLDALTAAALILHPSYVDPATGLPAPPEIAVDALLRARTRARTPRGRLERLGRDAVSWLLARF